MGSFITCSGEWPLTEKEPGPLHASGLRLTGVFVLVLAVGLLIGWIVRSGPAEVAELNQPAPDFTVEMIEGGEFTLSETRGQPVVLNLWASWCAPCRAEIPEISAFADSNPDVQVIGVAVRDTEQASRAFAEEMRPSYPLALGTQGVEDAYPNFGLPATYVIDEEGVVTEIFNGVVDEEILTELLG